jgi:ADP-ribose pyrophosphatase
MGKRILESEVVFQGEVFSVRVDQVASASLEPRRIDVVEHDEAVALLPIQDDGRIIFVRQYRHPASESLLELPAGTLNPGEKPEDCAVRECREETGMSPGRLTSLGGTYLAPGYSTEFIHYYLAEDLSYDPLTPDENEELEIEQLTWDEVKQLISRKGLRDAKTLAGLVLASFHLGQPILPQA